MGVDVGIGVAAAKIRSKVEEGGSSTRSSSPAPKAKTRSAPTSPRPATSTSTRTSSPVSADAAERAALRSSADTGDDRVSLSVRAAEQAQAEAAAAEAAELREQKERELAEEREHEERLRQLDEDAATFDHTGGGDTDGVISREDLEKVARGDFNRDAARERLQGQGLSDSEVEDRLERIQDTARYWTAEENAARFGALDGSNDDGETDGRISRGDLDRSITRAGETVAGLEAEVAELQPQEAAPPTDQEIADFTRSLERWQGDPEALSQDLQGRELRDMNPAELEALAVYSERNPEQDAVVREAVVRSVEGAGSLEDLPPGEGYQFLLRRHVTDAPPEQAAEAREKLGTMLDAELDRRLQPLLEDRRGDGELELAQDRFFTELGDLAQAHPALVGDGQEDQGLLGESVERVFAQNADRFTDVARADDSLLQRANHAVTGGIRSGLGWAGDRLEDAGDLIGHVQAAPVRLAGWAADQGLDLAGRAAGAGLDAVGLDGAADTVREGADGLGDTLHTAASTTAGVMEDVYGGIGHGASGLVTGVGEVVVNPVGTARGVYELGLRASTFVPGGQGVTALRAAVEGRSFSEVAQGDATFFADTARAAYADAHAEHGAAGVVGQVGFDVVTTVFTGGGGAAARGTGAAGRLGSALGRTSQFLDDAGRFGRVGTGAARLLDDASRLPGAVAQAPTRLYNRASQLLGGTAGHAQSFLDDVGQRGGRIGGAAQRGADLLEDALPGLRSRPDVGEFGRFEGGGRVRGWRRDRQIQSFVDNGSDLAARRGWTDDINASHSDVLDDFTQEADRLRAEGKPDEAARTEEAANLYRSSIAHARELDSQHLGRLREDTATALDRFDGLSDDAAREVRQALDEGGFEAAWNRAGDLGDEGAALRRHLSTEVTGGLLDNFDGALETASREQILHDIVRADGPQEAAVFRGLQGTLHAADDGLIFRGVVPEGTPFTRGYDIDHGIHKAADPQGWRNGRYYSGEAGGFANFPADVADLSGRQVRSASALPAENTVTGVADGLTVGDTQVLISRIRPQYNTFGIHARGGLPQVQFIGGPRLEWAARGTRIAGAELQLRVPYVAADVAAIYGTASQQALLAAQGWEGAGQVLEREG